MKEYIKQECGDVLFIESIALKFHREVLNFEYEADLNMESIKIIASKIKIKRDKNSFNVD
jgi:hypothetical protein